MEPITHDRLAGITAFVAAAEAGSFAQAAVRLGLTRSAIGKAIARLEARVGARLFVRTTRSLALTDDGQAFYERCAQALEELDAAQHMLEAGRGAVAGRVRVSAPVVFGRHHVAPLLLQLADRHPQLRLEGNFTDRLVDFADDGIDLAIRSGRLPDSDTLVARPLGTQAMVLCAAPGYLRRHGTPASAAALLSHQCLVYLRGSQPVPWSLADTDGNPVRPELSHRLAFDDIDTLAMAAIRGAGVANLPLWLVRAPLQQGTLVRLLPQASASRTPLHLVWPRTRFLPHKLRVTIDLLVAALPAVLTVD